MVRCWNLKRRGGYSNSESSLDTRIGNIFFGTDGYLELDGTTWKAFRKREKNHLRVQKRQLPNRLIHVRPPGGTEHYANFIDAIRAGS